LISLANNLGMATTAEGVETRAQLEWLRQECCTEIQGYVIVISRPVPQTDIRLLLANDQLRNVA
jgi:EAL domain-containing protein (putative c-di-GMP-specific phosphodiesterase class I)